MYAALQKTNWTTPWLADKGTSTGRKVLLGRTLMIIQKLWNNATCIVGIGLCQANESRPNSQNWWGRCYWSITVWIHLHRAIGYCDLPSWIESKLALPLPGQPSKTNIKLIQIKTGCELQLLDENFKLCLCLNWFLMSQYCRFLVFLSRHVEHWRLKNVWQQLMSKMNIQRLVEKQRGDGPGWSFG